VLIINPPQASRSNLSELSTLASRINQEHEQAEQKALEAIYHARNAGALLLEAKSLCAHGTWGEWLSSNFKGSERTAQTYMRVANHWPELEAKTQRVADLSLRGALELLSSQKEEPTKTEEIEGHSYLAQDRERLHWFCRTWYDDRRFLTLLLDTAGETPEAISDRLGASLKDTLAIIDPVPPPRFNTYPNTSHFITTEGTGDNSAFEEGYRALVQFFIHNAKWTGYSRAASSCQFEGYEHLKPALEALAEHYKRRADQLQERYRSLVRWEDDRLGACCLCAAWTDADHALGVQALSEEDLMNFESLWQRFYECAIDEGAVTA
jgi:hypothetical protein